MTLVDAGPLIALIDRDDTQHQRCVAALSRVTEPLVTTLPALTEAMHVIGTRAGWHGQERLWTFMLRANVELAELAGAQLERARDLMERYRDLPMDLADATLVAVAEERKVRRVFTLDSDFQVYRIGRRQAFEVVP